MKYKLSSSRNDFFGAFQVILSNGTSSPMFTAKLEKDKDMKSVNIQNYAMVKRINGSKGSSYIHKLSFKKKDGTEITKIEIGIWNSYGQESVIADDEEIIGVFGTKDYDNYIWQLGFIVWKPPQI